VLASESVRERHVRERRVGEGNLNFLSPIDHKNKL
jgi:hypothetical protein